LTKEQILAADTGAGASDLDEAIVFLRDELVDGAVPAKDVYRDGEGIGIARRTLERAKSRIGIKARRQGEKGKRGSGVWVWELPADLDRQDIPLTGESQSQKDLHRQERHTEEIGDLEDIEPKKEGVTEGLGDLNTKDTPDDSLPPPHPIQPCRCGCGDYWLREASQWGPAEWLCRKCHPEPRGDRQ
jgi:hypothetical protein